jgi:hypothetical protein
MEGYSKHSASGDPSSPAPAPSTHDHASPTKALAAWVTSPHEPTR